jgi:hypothetical protein
MGEVDGGALVEALKKTGGMGEGPVELDIPDTGLAGGLVAEIEAEQQDMKAAAAEEVPPTTLEGMASKNGISPQFAADMLTGAGLAVSPSAEWGDDAALKVGLWLQDAVVAKRSGADYKPASVENLSQPSLDREVVQGPDPEPKTLLEVKAATINLIIYFNTADQAIAFESLVKKGEAVVGLPSLHRVVVTSVAPVVRLQESEWKDV